MTLLLKQLRDSVILAIALTVTLPQSLTAQGTTPAAEPQVCPADNVDENSGAGESSPIFFGFAATRLLQICAIQGEGNSINRVEMSVRSTGSSKQLIHRANGKPNGGPFSLNQDETHIVLWITNGASTFAVVHCWNPRVCDDRDTFIVEASSSTTAKKTICTDIKSKERVRPLNELSACDLFSGLNRLPEEIIVFDDSGAVKVLDTQIFKVGKVPQVIEMMKTLSPTSR